MKVLKINSIGGLYQEMFQPNPKFHLNKPEIYNNTLDASGYFWSSFFCEQRIKKLIELLELNSLTQKYLCPQYRGILSNKEMFINRVMVAPQKLCYETDTPQEFFSYVETISILCKLYSEFEYHPFKIDVQNGFNLDTTSSKKIYTDCLNPTKNPYYYFVVNKIMPIIQEYDPDIIFLYGPMSFYFAAIAVLAKQIKPNLHICLSRHSSEYYSLNKITDLLKHNEYLFRIVDSLILEYFNDIEEQLIDALESKKGLYELPNIIFRDNNTIIETKHDKPSMSTDMSIYYRMNNCKELNKKVFDIHFDPNIKCYWNKCTFCGINKKYRNNDIFYSDEILNDKLLELHNLSKQCKYFWFVDEAIQPKKLKKIAESFLEKKTTIIWQARCRADHALIENGLPELLSKSGLRELRIGLESASYRILKLMNKFDDNFNLDLIESIVSNYDKNGISVHCPMIIGFPQETESERQLTYEFLAKLSNKYPSFSFNLNILNLDVSSELYKKWANFNLDKLEYPCEPYHFIGNSIAWIAKQDHEKLVQEINEVTRNILFPWIPASALTPNVVFYRFCETSRNTLRWKDMSKWNEKNILSIDNLLSFSDDVAISKENEQYFFYHWKTHHHIVGNSFFLKILEEFKNPQKVSTAIQNLIDYDSEIYKTDDLTLIIEKLFYYKFLENYHERR